MAYISLSLDRDTNGNKTLRLSFPKFRGFTVQTNGNLPETHRMTPETFDYQVAINEVREHIKRFGTLRQRDLTGWTLFS